MEIDNKLQTTQSSKTTGPLKGRLSAFLLVLTVFFVMLAEVFIYVPSIARYRVTFMNQRLDSSYIAALALEGTPDYMVSPELAEKLLAQAMVEAVLIEGVDRPSLMLGEPKRYMTDAQYDLRVASTSSLVVEAFRALFRQENRLIKVTNREDMNPSEIITVVMHEAPMIKEMRAFSARILALSIVISLITAILIYLTLHRMLVQPLTKMAENLVTFRRAPEDPSRTLIPSDRKDEVGMVERELARMQAEVRLSLKQQARLAGLGAAVSKINHDLRNVLTTAHLVSDRFARSEDPEVRRTAPRVINALDRAINLCTLTLEYGKVPEAPPAKEEIDIQTLAEDILDTVQERFEGRVPSVELRLETLTTEKLMADWDQLYRVVLNLVTNAFQAFAEHHTQNPSLTFRCLQENEFTVLEISDNGPGLPPQAQENLFKPFAGTTRKNGSGLGLAISRDILRAHGGDITLKQSSTQGTTFALSLPPENTTE